MTRIRRAWERDTDPFAIRLNLLCLPEKGTLTLVMLVPYLSSLDINEDGLTFGRHYSYADFLMLPLAVIAGWFLIWKRRSPSPSVWACLGVASSYFIAGYANETLALGALLANMKIWLCNGLLCYLVIVCCDRIEQRVFMRYIAAVFAVVLFLYGLSAVGTAWQHQFDNSISVLGGGANFNIIALVYVILAAMFLSGILSGEAPLASRIGVVVSVSAVIMCFSRSAYIALACTMLAASRSVSAHRLGRTVRTVALIFVVGICALHWGVEAVPGAKSFIAEKLARTGNEVAELRLGELTINPIVRWWDAAPSVIFLGDGKSFQHSVLSHATVMTGILGFIVMMVFYIQIVARAYGRLRSMRISGETHAVSLLVLVGLTIGMFVQDCAANGINHSALASSLFAIAVGFFESHRTALWAARIPLYGEMNAANTVTRPRSSWG